MAELFSDKTADLGEGVAASPVEPVARVAGGVGLRGPQNPALETFQRNARRRYGSKAPAFTARVDNMVGAMRQMAPSAARDLEDVSLTPGGRSFASSPHHIELGRTNPATALHELGHAVDMRNHPPQFFGDRGFFGLGGDGASQLPSEASATRQAFSHLGQADPRLAMANGTYWEGVYRPLTFQSHAGRLQPSVEGRIDATMARLYAHDDALERYRKSRNRSVGGLDARKSALLTRLQAAADRRTIHAIAHADALRNPVASPRLQTESMPEYRPRAVVDAMNRDIGYRAGDVAYDALEDVRARNFQRELPAARRAREYFGIPDPYAQGAGQARGVLGLAERALPQPANAQLSLPRRAINAVAGPLGRLGARLAPLLRSLY